MTVPSVRVLLNPRAGAGSAVRRLPEVRDALRRRSIAHDVAETRGPGDARRLAAQARDEGVGVLAVMGGDGTLNEVAQAYLDEEGKALGGPAIAVVPAGTGGDYKRTLGLTGEVEDAVSRIARGQERAHDLGFLRLTGHGGEPVARAFVNITSFGLGGVTDKLVNEGPKWLGGKAAFFLGSARALLQYRNTEVRVSVDGRTFVDGPILNVAMAIGRYFGGGMHIAPDADPADGLFEIISMGDLSKAQAATLSSKIYAGTHLSVKGITKISGASVEAVPTHRWSKVLIDMDGETPGMLPLRATVVKGAMRVLT